MAVTIHEDSKRQILEEIEAKVGYDIGNLEEVHYLRKDLLARRECLQKMLNDTTGNVPEKLSEAIAKAEENCTQIKELNNSSDKLSTDIKIYLEKIQPIRDKLSDKFDKIEKLEKALYYMKSLEKLDDICKQLNHCSDQEQSVLLYGEIKSMCDTYSTGHRAAFFKETLHYWHNIIKDKLAIEYEAMLKQLKWPFSNTKESLSAPPGDIIAKFFNITKLLFLIQLPSDCKDKENVDSSNVAIDDQEACLPVKLLLKPLRKRFAFHFTGNQRTARLDKPEWFLTQTLNWIRDHVSFVKMNVQPVANKIQIHGIHAEREFINGLISLVAERLHTVLAMSASREGDGETSIAHAIDETLGFHRELCSFAGPDYNAVLSVLTRAETFVKWLAIEKKYALIKMEETLSEEQWMAPIDPAGEGPVAWAPRASHWFMSLLRTIEDRYAVLPQPGHRLQFLELQLELIEEWRVRLTQLAGAGSPAAPPAAAALNAAHHTRAVLLQWAHSLHYLQLHYYRRQFQHFTELQHQAPSAYADKVDDKYNTESSTPENLPNSLVEVEDSAKRLAEKEANQADGKTLPSVLPISMSPMLTPLEDSGVAPSADESELEDAGVFGELPALLARLRNAGLAALADDIMLHFKASMRDYRRQKWHAMTLVEEEAISVSAALCEPLGGLGARLQAAASLAPPLLARLRSYVASQIDIYIYQEMVLENWWSPGGAAQLQHDVRRCLLPLLATHARHASTPTPALALHHLPRLCEACTILNMGLAEARELKGKLAKDDAKAEECLSEQNIRHLPPREALQLLSQRTDLNNRSQRAQQSLLDVF